jgi:hypothetical protein
MKKISTQKNKTVSWKYLFEGAQGSVDLKSGKCHAEASTHEKTRSYKSVDKI